MNGFKCGSILSPRKNAFARKKFKKIFRPRRALDLAGSIIAGSIIIIFTALKKIPNPISLWAEAKNIPKSANPNPLHSAFCLIAAKTPIIARRFSITRFQTLLQTRL